MKTTAEGTMSSELDRTLTSLGCSTGQGYYYAPPPGPDAALAHWLERQIMAAQ